MLLENLKLRPRSMLLDRGLRFSSNDRTDEVIELFIIWLFLQEKFLLMQKLTFYIW